MNDTTIETSQTCLTVEYIDPNELRPSFENSKVYRPVNSDDPAIIELSADIAKNGVLEPLVVTLDNYILSGHRRQKAAIEAGLDEVPVKVVNIYHSDPAFLSMLVSYNTQRIKNQSEQFHEAVIQSDPDEAYAALIAYRKEKTEVKVDMIQVEERKSRKVIGELKSEMRSAISKIVYEYEDYWPLSDRQIHYLLLNCPPLRNTKLNTRYGNNIESYKDTSDMLVRMRLNGDIPMVCIVDETRPTTEWNVHSNPQDFAREELGDFLKNYRRNVQQSQPLHVEIIVEKLTLKSIIRPVCAKFNAPFTVGRGYSSLPSRWEIIKRFRKSGKEKLCLIILGDFDPEGINIGESLLQSMRKDFGEENAVAIRAGLNVPHIKRFELSNNLTEAKTEGKRYKKFYQRFGKFVYEIEALKPEQIQQVLTEAIDSVIDKDLFNKELEAERQDAAYLQAVRNKTNDYLYTILEDDNDDNR